jgi:ATP-dependent protease HslVU (ClpYQ) peptidase subunit
MTCIIGLEHGGRVYMGGDSAAVNNVAIYQTSIRKVFRAGPFMIGWTSSFRMGQILQYQLEVPVQTSDQDDMQYMVTVFVEAVYDALKTYRYDKDREQDSGGTFLAGYNGKLYTVYADYQVQHHIPAIAAVGSGGEFALGAMTALKDMPAKKRIKQALKAAGAWSDSVCGPYYVMEL